MQKHRFNCLINSFFYCIFVTTIFITAEKVAAQELSIDQSTGAISIQVSTQIVENKPVVALEPFEWQIIVQWHGDLSQINPEVLNNPIPETLNLLKRSTTLRAHTEQEQRIAQKIFSYHIQAPQAGDYTIHQAEFTYRLPGDAQTLTQKTSPHTISVMPTPFRFSKWLVTTWNAYKILWVLSLLLLITVVAVTLFYKTRKPKLEAMNDSETAIDLVQQHLMAAKKERIEGNISKYAVFLEQAIIESMNQQFKIKINRLTEVHQHIKVDQHFYLNRFLNSYEQAKYSPESPSQSLWDQLWNDANALIPHTKIEQ